MVLDLRFVYLIPLLAFAVVVVRLLARGSAVGSRDSVARGLRTSGPGPALIIGLGGLILCGSMFAFADRDLTTYRNDPSCQAAFAVATSSGVCRVASMHVVTVYHVASSRYQGAHTHLVLERGDGRQVDVVVGHDRRGSVARGFSDANDREATVQLFREKIVLVDSTSGLMETSEYPAQRTNRWAVLGITLGTGGVLLALYVAIRGPRSNAPVDPFGTYA